MIEWNTTMAVGVERIDAQHRELFRKLAALSGAIAAGDATGEARRTVAFLAQYVRDHFAMEENLIDKHGYPASASHKLQHEMFTRELVAMQAKLEADGYPSALVLSLQKWATDWLVNHIARTDKLLGTFLQSKQAA